MLAKIKAWWQSLFISQAAQDDDLVTPKPEATEIKPWLMPSFKGVSSRKLDPELEKAIDDICLKLFGEKFKAAVSAKDANTVCGMAAEAMVAMGIREATNKNDGKWVEKIQKVAGGSRGHAWCMYFDQVCIAYAEAKTGKKSKVYNSGSCASVRKHSASMAISPKDSMYGDLWIWFYTATGTGHTGIFEAWIKKAKEALMNEGNTTKGKVGEKIVREGGGAYQTERALITDTKASMYLKMVIRPF